MKLDTGHHQQGRRSRRQCVKRVLLYIGFGLTLLLLTRNVVVAYAIEKLASHVLAAPVKVGQVAIGWSEIAISDLTVMEPSLKESPQFRVARVSTRLSIVRGIHDGIWLDWIVVEAPELHIRFDKDGNLISKFPSSKAESSGEPIGQIPIRSLTLHRASLVVHQDGRETFCVSDVSIRGTFDESIKVTLSVPEVFGSKVRLQSTVDARSFAGQTRLSIPSVRLDSHQLSRLPLVPGSLAADHMTANLSLDFECSHPENIFDIRNHDWKLRISVEQVDSDCLGLLCQRCELVAANESGIVGMNVTADPLGCEFLLSGHADTLSTRPQVELASSLTNVNAGPFGERIASLERFAAVVGFEANVRASLEDTRVHFVGHSDLFASRLNVLSIDLPDSVVTIDTDGSLDPSDLTTLDGSLSIQAETEAFDLAAVAHRLALPPASGRLAADVRLDIPLASISDPKDYLASGSLNLNDVSSSGFALTDTSVAVDLINGILNIAVNPWQVKDRLGQPFVTSHADMSLSLLDDRKLSFTSEFDLESSPSVAQHFGLAEIHPKGRVHLTARGQSTLDSIMDVNTWLVETRLDATGLGFANETIQDIHLLARLDESQLRTSPLVLRWRQSECVVRGAGSLGQKTDFRGDLHVDRVDLSDVARLASKFSQTPLPIRGLAELNGAFVLGTSFDQQPMQFQASGSAKLLKAAYAGASIGEAALQWQADPDGLSLISESNHFLGGRYRAVATMRDLDWTKSQLNGSFSGVSVPRLLTVASQKLASAGTLEGGFRVSSIASLEELDGEAWLRSRQLSFLNLPSEFSNVRVAVTNGQIAATGDGRLSDGRLEFAAHAPTIKLADFLSNENRPLAQIPLTFHANLSDLTSNKIVDSLRLPNELKSLGLRVSGECIRDEAALEGRHLARASASIEDLRWKHGRLSDRITANVTLHPARAELTGISGRFADGTLSGSGIVDFSSSLTGHFDVSANRVSLRRASSPLGVRDVSGSGTIRLKGRIGSVVTGRADVSVDHAAVSGVTVRHASFPVDWSYACDSRNARWRCRGGKLSAGGGKINVASEGTYNRALTMNTMLAVDDVELSKLMRGGSPTSGIVNGELSLRAKRAVSINQIVGDYAFQFENMQAMNVPVLDQLPNMITLSPPVPGRGKDGGTVHGRIGSGLVHVDELALHQSNVQVLVSGTATMEGRLDMDVVASTGSDSPTDQLMSLLDSPLMLAAPAPVAMVVKANEMLKDRVVRVHVGGTATRPTLRLQPGKQLGQDAVRFFLTSGFGATADRITHSKSKLQYR